MSLYLLNNRSDLGIAIDSVTKAPHLVTVAAGAVVTDLGAIAFSIGAEVNVAAVIGLKNVAGTTIKPATEDGALATLAGAVDTGVVKVSLPTATVTTLTPPTAAAIGTAVAAPTAAAIASAVSSSTNIAAIAANTAPTTLALETVTVPITSGTLDSILVATHKHADIKTLTVCPAADVAVALATTAIVGTNVLKAGVVYSFACKAATDFRFIVATSTTTMLVVQEG
jgi:hypothetical protein